MKVDVVNPEIEPTPIIPEQENAEPIPPTTSPSANYLYETDQYLQQILATRSRRLLEEQSNLSDHDFESRLHTIESTVGCLEKVRRLM